MYVQNKRIPMSIAYANHAIRDLATLFDAVADRVNSVKHENIQHYANNAKLMCGELHTIQSNIG
jgi:hypothetical protein